MGRERVLSVAVNVAWIVRPALGRNPGMLIGRAMLESRVSTVLSKTEPCHDGSRPGREPSSTYHAASSSLLH